MVVERPYRLLFAFMGLFGALTALGGQEKTLSVDQCVAIALEQNPLVLSSLAQYAASLARIKQAKALPQPTLSFDSDLQSKLLDFQGSRESYVGFNQTLEFPGKRTLRGRIAARESDQVLADIEILKLDLAFQVKQAFYGLLLAQEKVRYARQDLELAEDFQAKAERKLAAGDTAEVEVLRARVETSKAANAVKTAENENRLAAAALNFLLARRSSEPLEIRGDLKRPPINLDVEEFKTRALAVRPEIKQTQSAIERESLRKKQAYLSYWPDFDVGISRHRIEGERTTWDFTLALSVPLFFWQPKTGPVAEAEAAIEVFKREVDHLENEIRLEVEEATLSALTARGQIELFEREILGQAEEVYNAFLYSFQKGEIGGIELIEARRSLNEARKSYADALHNYQVTIAALERSIGQTIKGDRDEE